jgi:hypothetical protein
MEQHLWPAVRALEDEVKEIKRRQGVEVEAFQTTFFNRHPELGRDYEVVYVINLSDGAIILKWKSNESGPYWQRCRYRAFKQKNKKGKQGRMEFDYIGAVLPAQEKYRFANAEKADKWKFVRDVANWEQYEAYDKRVNELRAQRTMLTNKIRSLKNSGSKKTEKTVR